MDFALPSPRRAPEAILPMANVVFLLLLFFLMAATLVPPPPVAVTPPIAAAGAPPGTGGLRLSLGADGGLGFEAARGPAALAALTERLADAGRRAGAGPVPVVLHADRAAPAHAVAAVLRDLAARGAGPVWLITRPVP